MEVCARLRNYRISPQKARLVAEQVRGLAIGEALARLQLSGKKFARPLEKLLRSALANAEQRNNRDKAGIDVDNLVVKTIAVDQGVSSWRIRPRAQGRASWIQKKSCHVTVVLTER